MKRKSKHLRVCVQFSKKLVRKFTPNGSIQIEEEIRTFVIQSGFPQKSSLQKAIKHLTQISRWLIWILVSHPEVISWLVGIMTNHNHQNWTL